MIKSPVITRWHRTRLGALLLAAVWTGAAAASPKQVPMVDPLERGVAPFSTVVPALCSTVAGGWGEAVAIHKVALFRFRQLGLREWNRWLIAATLGFCLLQAALIISLLVNRTRRRQGEAAATLLADISSKFVNLPASEVDREIEDAQRRICGLLGLDLAALWQWSMATPRIVTLTHLYRPLGGPPLPEPMYAHEHFPWCQQQLEAGRMILVPSIEKVPAEAARDREVWRHLGIKSVVTFPLSPGGQVMGALSFNTMRSPHKWPAALVTRLELLAQIFTHALARKHADEALRASEARLAAGVDLAGLGYYELDFGEGNSFVDEGFQAICGVASGRHPGLQSLQFWMDHLHPDDRQRVLDDRQKLQDGRVDRLSIEYRFLHPEEGQKSIHHLAGVATRDAAGHAVRTFWVLRDITERRKAQLEAQELRGNLAHAGRVTLLGQLASALAHELSQPLGAILRNAETAAMLLQAPLPDVDELRAIVTDILSDDHRAGEVIERLRSLFKRRGMALLPLDLSGVLGEVLALLQFDAAARHVIISSSAPPGLPLVMGDRIHLQQVLLNLMMNAMDALQACPSGQRFVDVAVGPDGPHMIEVRVCDNGPGFPAGAMEHLFEPFFTTKANGMGMGLPVSKTIIEAHKGKLWAENGPAGGACFVFTVPVAGNQGIRESGNQ